MDFGEKLKLLRQERNLNQPELAEKLGIEQSYLSKLETGKSIPSADMLERILSCLGVGIEVLMDGVEGNGSNRQLRSLPQVAAFLAEGRTRMQLSRRRWIIGSALACVLGLTAAATWLAIIAFPDNTYQYVSEEIVPRGEAGEIFASLEDYAFYAAAQTALNDGDRERDPARLEIEIAADLIESRLANLRSPDFRNGFADRGGQYVESVIDEGALAALAASGIDNGATRTWQLAEIVPAYRIDPRLFLVLGVFGLFGGLFGFITEFKLYRSARLATAPLG